MKKLSLHLPDGREYPIVIGAGVLDDAALWQAHVPHRQVCVVSNVVVAPLYLPRIREMLAGREVIEVILADGERHKRLESVASILDALVDARFNRDCVVIALGGGVVGDIAGFAAACYQRGVDFVQMPTTLLAQVDSSVGGKTGVNHPRGKNLIGAFHQPVAVLVDTQTLSTLPPREFSAGLAEVIKYGLINDAPFSAWLEANMDAILRQDDTVLGEMIAHCCQNKAAIVAADERESGQRALLNLGHTFGHALEALTDYRRFKHGEAVAIGMHMAVQLAKAQGLLADADVARVLALLQRAQLPVHIDAELDAQAVFTAMGLDKKVKAGRMRLIVPQAFGQCAVVDDVPQAQILAAIEAARAA